MTQDRFDQVLHQTFLLALRIMYDAHDLEAVLSEDPAWDLLREAAVAMSDDGPGLRTAVPGNGRARYHHCRYSGHSVRTRRLANHRGANVRVINTSGETQEVVSVSSVVIMIL